MFGFGGTCPDFHPNAIWTVTVSGKTMARVPPGDVRPFRCEPVSDKNLSVACAAPAHLSERHELDLQIAAEE